MQSSLLREVRDSVLKLKEQKITKEMMDNTKKMCKSKLTQFWLKTGEKDEVEE